MEAGVLRRWVFVFLVAVSIFPSWDRASSGEEPPRPASSATTRPIDDAFAADRFALLHNVRNIAAPGIPGPLAVFGERAFVVAVGGVHADRAMLRAPVVAAATIGRGRVVAFGHTGYLDPATLKTGDTAALVENAIRWAAGRATERDATNLTAPRVGVIGIDGLPSWLTQHGFQARSISLRGDEVLRLDDVDVLCLSHAALTRQQ